MIERIEQHLPISYDTIRKRYGRAYLDACVRILLKMNASTRRWYNCGQKLFGGKYDRFCLSYTGGRTSNQYTVNVDGTWYCIRLGQFFGNEVTTLHVGAVESLSKFYNFLLKHKNENLWIPRLGEKFFVPYESKVRFDIWNRTDKQNQLQVKGLCFKTEKEAENYRQRYLVKNKTIIK